MTRNSHLEVAGAVAAETAAGCTVKSGVVVGHFILTAFPHIWLVSDIGTGPQQSVPGRLGMKVVTTEVLWSCLLLKRWPAAKESAVSLNKLLTSQLSGAEMPDRRQGHKGW